MNDYGSAESNTASDTSPSNGDLKLEGANSLPENEINGERNNTKVEHEEVEKKGGPDIYPLHYLVWHNNYRKLEKELTENKVNVATFFSIYFEHKPLIGTTRFQNIVHRIILVH